MRTKYLKRKFAKEVLALDAALGGDFAPARREIALGEISPAQCLQGMKARLTVSYSFFSYNNRKIASALKATAIPVLAGHRLPPSAVKLLSEVLDDLTF